MEMQGEYKIPAPRAVVWDALNDPDVLSACIPGCKSLERTGENGFAAAVQAKVGPVKATFKGEVTLSDIDPPNSYRISGEGKGGAAGFAKGGAVVTLTDDGDGTLLSYTVDANVGGKLAQIGSRLIDSTSKKLAGEFFDAFVEEVKKRNGDGSPVASESDAAENMEPPVVGDPVTMPIQNAAEASKTAGAASPAANDSRGANEASPDAPSPSQAAMKAADDVAKKRKGLQPMVWTIALIAIVIILIAAFASN
ncbi:MAG: carbon monoxide dehydrogenase subunit G [Alphaproteobacteria bacterium]